MKHYLALPVIAFYATLTDPGAVDALERQGLKMIASSPEE